MKIVNITDVCDIQVGKTPSRSNSSYWGEGSLWLSIADMNQGLELETTKETITEKAIRETNIKIAPENTVLFSFKLSIGKIGITKVPMYTNEAIATFLIKDHSKIDTKFLYYVLKSIDHSIGSSRAVMGKTLNKEKLKQIKIPLPSPEEQKRIVEELDKANLMKQKRNHAVALLDDYLKAVFLEMFGDPVVNEKGWETKTIEQIAKNERYSIKRGPFGGALKKEIFVNDGYLVYEQFHALNNDFSMARYFIDEKKFQELKAFEVKAGDIIISCSGVYLGKLAIVPPNCKKGVINQALLKVSLNEEIMKNILFVHIFTNENFKNKFFGKKIGSGIPNFPPMTTFKKFEFICPPIELQEEFVSIIDKIKILKQSMLTQSIELDTNFNALMQVAFA